MKVAIVYDRVNKFGGAERVLLSLHELFPKAPLYTSVYSKKDAKWAKVFPEIKTSFLQNILFARRNHEFFLPLMPLAFSLFNFDNYDLVISVTSEFAKNIRVKSKHICYCLTPTRYLWSGNDEYFKNKYTKILFWPLIWFMRKVDLVASKKPDEMIAISTEVQRRIKKYYKREAKIIFPPAGFTSHAKFKNRSHFKNFLLRGPHQNESASQKFFENARYYLIVSRLVKYKKIDLAIEAFNKLGLPLVIVGTGREEKKLKKMAGKNIYFAGFVDEGEMGFYYENAKALIFPQEEDFGIVAVEAQSFGVPIIAYKKGGACDTVIDGVTGIMFEGQTKESLIKAVKILDTKILDIRKIQRNARKFSDERFSDEFAKFAK